LINSVAFNYFLNPSVVVIQAWVALFVVSDFKVGSYQCWVNMYATNHCVTLVQFKMYWIANFKRKCHSVVRVRKRWVACVSSWVTWPRRCTRPALTAWSSGTTVSSPRGNSTGRTLSMNTTSEPSNLTCLDHGILIKLALFYKIILDKFH